MMEQTRREFIRAKRRSLKKLKKVLGEVRMGCALNVLFDGTNDFHYAFNDAWKAYLEMDKITKPLA